jgi:anti-sigma regulatory factor (Ser/Thr protein kinase)
MPTPAISAVTARTSTNAYPGTTDQARVVRADLRALLSECPHADDIVLCASELAANAARHSRSGRPGATMTVHADIRPGDHVLIEVRDDGGFWNPPPPDTDRAHGLDIVRTLATSWGVSGTDNGRVVWARFTWPAA